MKKNWILLLWILSIACVGGKKQGAVYPVGHIQTREGEIWIWLYKETPAHKESFIQLASYGYWDSLTFNRVVPNFVIQGGCPDTPAGFTDSRYLLAPEFRANLQHVYGAVGAGRDDNPDKCSARCQFYIVHNKQGLHRLDSNYTVFGNVFKGMDVVEAIAYSEKDSLDRPLNPITLDVDVLFLNESELHALGFNSIEKAP